jgi:integrase
MATAKNALRITKRVVDTLQPGDIIWDTDVTGFALRCQGKRKTYVLKARVNGRIRWFTIGRHGTPWTPETARHEAQRLWGDIRSGVNLVALREARREQPTVAELCDRFLKEHAKEHKKPGGYRNDDRNIRNHVKPLLGTLTVKEVTRNDVDAFKRSVRDGRTSRRPIRKCDGGKGGSKPVQGGACAANRCLALLSKMFNLAEQWGWRQEQSNPCRMVVRYPENRHQRFLSPEEIERLFIVLDSIDRAGTESAYATAAIRLLLLTGARRGEIIDLMWEHVDLGRGLLLLPDSKVGAKTIYLNSAATAVLRSLKRVQGNPYVIVGPVEGKPYATLQLVWERIRKKAELDNVRMHDLRHTFASTAAANGASLPMIGKLLGHTTPITTQRYAHLVSDPVRQVNEAVGEAITRRQHDKDQAPYTSVSDLSKEYQERT